jgi:hypothetical protein
LVFDTIATPETAKICAEAITSTSGGVCCNLMGVEFPRKDVESVFFLGYTVTGEMFRYKGEDWPAIPEDFERAVGFSKLAEALLAQDRFKAHPLRVCPGGLGGVLSGMQEMKEGKVSGKKLVYRIEDIDWSSV